MGSAIGMATMSRASSPKPGRAIQATARKASSKAPGDRHDDQRCDGQNHRGPGRYPEKVADAGEAAQFGQQGPDACEQEGRHGHPRPEAPEMMLDERRVSLSRDDAEAHREFLDHVENGDQDHLEEEEAVTPLRTALCRRHDAARVGVREHDDDTRAEHGADPLQSKR